MRVWFGRAAIVLGFVGGFTLLAGAQQGASRLDDTTAVDTSLAYLQSRASELGIRNAYEEFRPRQVVQDSQGETHVRLDQVYQGVPVFGQQLIVPLDRDGTAQSVTGAYLAGIALSTQPGISSQRARSVAQQRFPGLLAKTPEADLVLYPQDGDVHLVYRVVLRDDATPRRVVVFVDATTGKVVHSYNDLHTLLPMPSSALTGPPIVEPSSSAPERPQTPVAPAAGTGHSLYIGTVSITTDQGGSEFSMIDNTRGGLRASDMRNRPLGLGPGVVFTDADNSWGDGTTSDRASAAVDAHFGAEATWDYYLTVHGRIGIKGDGVGSLSRVHYRRHYNNAFWSDGCACMTYGDGDATTFTPFVSLDVAGHEMTHGVTSATAAFIFDKQPGGLDEAMDIFGTMIEFFAAAHGAAKVPNYLIGGMS